jgi:hypothetical protein
LLPHPARAVLYVEHVANGTDLFRVICEQDMSCREAGERPVHAGRDNVGED